MGNQVNGFDLLKDLLLSSGSPDISQDESSNNEVLMKNKKSRVKKNKPTLFGEKTIKHLLQECCISEIFYLPELLEHSEGFSDSNQLKVLICALANNRRREFTLGKGRKACQFLIWKWRASRVPLRSISLFQLVCTMKEPVLVEKYLKQGVDVNCQIDQMYNGEFAGRAPLHLALSHLQSTTDLQKSLATVNLLLHYGANINAKDSLGNTPLHTLFSGAPFDKHLFDIIMKNGADSYAVNNLGETAFELLVASNCCLDIENYIKIGGSINRFNSISHEGCIPDLVRRVSVERIGSALSLMEVDSQGRNAIHNIVSFFVAKAQDRDDKDLYYDDIQAIIKSIMKRGGSINCQDRSGKTPLHCAVGFQNCRSVSLLLRLGADMNIRDASGESALTLSLNLPAISSEETTRNDGVIKTFTRYLNKLGISGSLISQENKKNFNRASMKCGRDTEGEKLFHGELEQSE